MNLLILTLKKKGQVWITDVVFSIVLFTLACVLAFYILMNSFSEQKEFATSVTEAAKISDFIMSDGTPDYWNSSYYIRPGILSNNKLNETKLITAMKISNTSYSAIKSSYDLENDFMVLVVGRNDTILPFSGFCTFGNQSLAIDYENITGGCNNTRFDRLEYNDLAKVTRFAAYNGSVVKIIIYSWD